MISQSYTCWHLLLLFKRLINPNKCTGVYTQVGAYRVGHVLGNASCFKSYSGILSSGILSGTFCPDTRICFCLKYSSYLLQVIMPGYCVAGTIGHKILSGQRKIELDNRQTVTNI